MIQPVGAPREPPRASRQTDIIPSHSLDYITLYLRSGSSRRVFYPNLPLKRITYYNMSPLKCCIVLAALVWWAGGAPAHGTPRMDLSEVLDKAVCPIRVVIDEDKTRVPRLIKTLVCDKKPSAVCTSTTTSHACCHHHHHTFSTQCVEVTDRVLVRYAGSETPVALQVPVGCTCMIRESKQTKDSS